MRPPPGTMGRLDGGIFRILCSGTRPPAEDGEVGEREAGVDELELIDEDTQPALTLWLAPPRPDPGLLVLSQALYCSLPRPDPGRESLEKAGLDSWAAIAANKD